MPTVLDELSRSNDPIDQGVSRALRSLQSFRASRNLKRSLGYEPRDIRKFGAIKVIERRIGRLSSGFNDVPHEDSYAAIVNRYPDRFDKKIVEIARQRLGTKWDEFAPTADPVELDRKVKQLLEHGDLPRPDGTVCPRKNVASSTEFSAILRSKRLS